MNIDNEIRTQFAALSRVKQNSLLTFLRYLADCDATDITVKPASENLSSARIASVSTDLRNDTAQTVSSKALLGLAKALDIDLKQLADLGSSNIVDHRASAAKELSDEIYYILRDAQLTRHVANTLFNSFFDDKDDGSPAWRERVAIGYRAACMQFEVVTDYIRKIEEALDELDALANGRAPQ